MIEVNGEKVVVFPGAPVGVEAIFGAGVFVVEGAHVGSFEVGVDVGGHVLDEVGVVDEAPEGDAGVGFEAGVKGAIAHSGCPADVDEDPSEPGSHGFGHVEGGERGESASEGVSGDEEGVGLFELDAVAPECSVVAVDAVKALVDLGAVAVDEGGGHAEAAGLVACVSGVPVDLGGA